MTLKTESRTRFKILQGILPIRLHQIPGEIVAGITLAALAIPEVMGYTKIAGTPVITGLYTMLLPLGMFAVFGASRHLVVGADSATAAMLSVGLAGLAHAGSPDYVALAGILSLIVAAFLMIARIFQLGFLANFLSRTVLVGFLTGIGIQVAVGQIPGMLGLTVTGHNTIDRLVETWQQSAHVQPYALGMSAGVLVVVIALKRLSKRIPGVLITVALAIAVTWTFNLESKGVAVIGHIPGGIPKIGLPAVTLTWSIFQKLLPIAFGMFIVILAQSAATARAYADRHDEHFDQDTDLIGLGMANIGAALSGTFIVNGSPTKTQMVDSAGATSQLSQVAAALTVLLVLIFLTEPLSYMPEAVLCAVVFLIGIELVDIEGMKQILTERPWEFWVALITALIVVFWGVEQSILMAVLLSLIFHTRHGYHPKNTVMIMTDTGKWRSLPVSHPGQVLPGLMIYRFNHSMYYANSTQLSKEIQWLVKGAEPELKWFCIDCVAVDDIDFSAAKTLHGLKSFLGEQNIRLVFASASADVKKELNRSGLSQPADKDVYAAFIDDVVNNYIQNS